MNEMKPVICSSFLCVFSVSFLYFLRAQKSIRNYLHKSCSMVCTCVCVCVCVLGWNRPKYVDRAQRHRFCTLKWWNAPLALNSPDLPQSWMQSYKWDCVYVCVCVCMLYIHECMRGESFHDDRSWLLALLCDPTRC